MTDQEKRALRELFPNHYYVKVEHHALGVEFILAMPKRDDTVMVPGLFEQRRKDMHGTTIKIGVRPACS